MNRVSRAWGLWVATLARREAGTALAVFRMAMGLICLHLLVDVAWSGVDGWVWADRTDGGVIRVGQGHWLLKWMGGVTPDSVARIMFMAGLGSVSVVLGVAHRLGALVSLQALLALFAMNPMSGGGHDLLITNGLWILVLAPAGETLSLMCRLRTGRWTSTRPVASWPRYLLVFQIAMVYTITGLQKVGPAWMPWGDFSAVYLSVLQPTYARADWSWVAWVYPLTQLGTVVTWLWELSWPVVLVAFWFRLTHDRPGRLRGWSNRWDVRSGYIAVGVALHLGIEVFLNVGPFSYISMAYYAACFHADEWSRAGGWLRRRLGQGQGQTPSER